jgi:hypothetical protein
VLASQLGEGTYLVLGHQLSAAAALAECHYDYAQTAVADSYSGLQYYASSVGATLVIAHRREAKLIFVSTNTRSHESENRYKASREAASHTMVGMPFIRHIPLLSLSRILFLLQSRQPFNSTW